MSPKIRQTIYLLGTAAPALLGIALIWGGLDAESAADIGDIIAGVVSILVSGAPAVAAGTVRSQRKDGTLSTSPVDQVTKGVEQVLAARQNAEDEVAKVKQALETAVSGALPQLGPLATQILNVADDSVWRP
ncbi:holin [Mycobacterium phage Serenity]|uniref:holin n=1 Tax=Mycobacterium phage Serenity TaxID=1701853 RepID=UPI0006CE341B|nr:holin [Mycobacterium phage Serenity]ALF00877.1 holin [Mycobacterium phage Serenity]